MYPLLKPFLFTLEAERSHRLTLTLLSIISRNQVLLAALKRGWGNKINSHPIDVMGLTFPNIVGLAAGLDKHAQAINAFAAMGFGFIEVGTVTPLPQTGNPEPRLFRLNEKKALINRMGFNSIGVDAMVNNLVQQKFAGIVGVNIGKNATTPVELAVNDYLIGLEKVYSLADYITVNISSPNTKNLRDLQSSDQLNALLQKLKSKQSELASQQLRYVPIALKIAPDLDEDSITDIAQTSLHHCIDAIIATNTTVARPDCEHHPLSAESGGLSGAPLKESATNIITKLQRSLAGQIPIIGVGGISNRADAKEKISAGACLLQIYSSLIYQGPSVVQEVASLTAE